MLDKKGLSILYFVLIILSSFRLFATNSAQIIDPGSKKLAPLSIEYTSHSSIIIATDADLYLFPGSGTHEEPFLIEGFNITSSDLFGIHISSTTKHVLIRNCFIDVSKTGILIEDKLEGSVRIENCIITNSENENSHGVAVYIAKEIVLKNNIISGHSSSGLVMIFINGAYIVNNSFSSNNDSGLEVAYVDTLGIFENECNDNKQIGMYVGGSDNVMIMENDCSNNGEEGIYLEQVEGCSILNNTIESNRVFGMKMDGARWCLLNYNLFRDNYERGLYLDEDCENNWTYLNDFINNSRNSDSQGRDEGVNNDWFSETEKNGNYWSTLENSKVYNIHGKAESVDLYPLEKPITHNLSFGEDISRISYNWMGFSFFLLLIKMRKKSSVKTNKN